MKLQGSTILITGANRGLGAAFAQAALAAGARKIYAAVRDPSRVDIPGLHPVRLDVTSTADIAALQDQCRDVSLLINNAGISRPTPFLDPGMGASLQAELATNLL